MTAIVSVSAPTTTVVSPVTADLDVIVDQVTLLASLSYLKLGVPNRATVPVLAGVKLHAVDGKLHLATFDFDMALTDTIDAAGSGVALVNHAMLLDLVKGMDKGCVVSLKVTDGRLALTGGDIVYRIGLLALADYPALPVAAPNHPVTLDAQLVKDITAQVTISAGKDDTLPVLTGLFFNSLDGTLSIAATDRYRLGVIDTDLAWDGAALIPRSTWAAITKAFPGEAVTLTFTGAEDKTAIRYVTASAGERTVTGRLLDGEFPKYRSLLPAESSFQSTFTVDSAVLARAIEQVAKVNHNRTSPVRLSLQEKVELLAGTDDNTAARKLAGTPTGEMLVIGFNPAFMTEALKALGKGEITISFTSPTRPFILTSPSAPAYRHLLMPVRMPA